MPVEFRTASPSPARVHENARALTGHHPCWRKRDYRGGLFSTEHFRTCTYCGCVHPGDLIDLLLAGSTRLEPTAKLGKIWMVTPNPLAGELVRMGSLAGPIFAGTVTYLPPGRRARAPARSELPFEPTEAERLAGHYDRPVYEVAPPMIRWPFYSEHTNERQWAEIAEAATKGEGPIYALPAA